MARLLLLNGPNLNLLGSREPGFYGADTLAAIDERMQRAGRRAGHDARGFQSNAEHELVDRGPGAARRRLDFLILNPGAFTHTSVALREPCWR